MLRERELQAGFVDIVLRDAKKNVRLQAAGLGCSRLESLYKLTQSPGQECEVRWGCKPFLLESDNLRGCCQVLWPSRMHS